MPMMEHQEMRTPPMMPMMERQEMRMPYDEVTGESGGVYGVCYPYPTSTALPSIVQLPLTSF